MNEIARRENSTQNLVEIARESETIQALGKTLIDSGLLPDSIKKPEAAMLIMLKGREIGMDAIYALSHISVINGKPAMSAEAMLALVQRSGHAIRLVENTSERCVVEGVRANDPGHPSSVEWTMEDARTAGLSGKGPWKTYPRAMLRSRAVSELCRAMFADVLSGVSYVPEELGAVVNEEGEVIEAATASEGPDATDAKNGDSREANAERVEEAEVVENAEDAEEEHDRLMNLVAEKMDEFPEGTAPDSDTVYSFANDGVEPARRTLAKLNKDLERTLEGAMS